MPPTALIPWRNPQIVPNLSRPRPLFPGRFRFGKIIIVQVVIQPAFAALRRGIFSRGEKMVGVTGVEPVTLRLSSACSNQLSYTPRRRASRYGGQAAKTSGAAQAGLPAAARSSERRLVELRRLELLTYSLQSYRSTN